MAIAETLSAAAREECRGRRALIVGADPATLRLCRDVLERSGFAIDAVESGIAAIVASRKSVPGLILLDAQLSDVPGRDAILWLRSNPALQSTPIAVLTANALDDAIPALAWPARPLRKPVSPAAIRCLIGEILE